MTVEQLLDQVLATARFAPTQDARAELFELLVEAYAAGESAYTVAHSICRYLEIDPREHSYPLQLVLRPEFDR